MLSQMQHFIDYDAGLGVFPWIKQKISVFLTQTGKMTKCTSVEGLSVVMNLNDSFGYCAPLSLTTAKSMLHFLEVYNPMVGCSGMCNVFVLASRIPIL